jgi:anamorsin
MAPVAIYVSPALSALAPVSAPKQHALAIGSLSTAKDGKYQTLVSNLEQTGPVERQMLDRLVDGGANVVGLDALESADWEQLLPSNHHPTPPSRLFCLRQSTEI